MDCACFLLSRKTKIERRWPTRAAPPAFYYSSYLISLDLRKKLFLISLLAISSHAYVAFIDSRRRDSVTRKALYHVLRTRSLATQLLILVAYTSATFSACVRYATSEVCPAHGDKERSSFGRGNIPVTLRPVEIVDKVYTEWSKKVRTRLFLPLTLSNKDRFAKFF